MSDLHQLSYPNESAEYRRRRDELLRQEIALRESLEQLAALRRQLPPGGVLKEDYVFDELVDNKPAKTNFSTLFDEGKNTLLVYNFMYAAGDKLPCPACNSMIDGLNGSARHIRDKVNFVVVARAPIEKFVEWGESRGWTNLRLLSSTNNSYNHDYFGESEDGSQQMPVMNVFHKNSGEIHHTYGTEMLFTAPAEHQHPRHADLFWPIWNLFDLTPEGRGPGWFPKHDYD